MKKIKYRAVAFLFFGCLAIVAMILAANKHFEKCTDCKQVFSKSEFGKVQYACACK